MKAKVLLAVMAAALLLAACQSPAATDKKAEKRIRKPGQRRKGGVWKLRSRRIERYKDKHEYYI
ncbi:hypothetical protein LAJLEIBI_02960 [[Clostridium] hylemonae DSM 15053]|uniref:hypothetical protein n=1 Tax=[Clostridium] hylemonae TaxID=89153 RepID=UPI00125BA3F0|nr:hypothetical protein [[Clostridium] hylemonae]QEK18936.1 hypothetical protein LAJLEIBI_02960 [[Clostridium] hylemonae DSM 15053]